jgi:sterol desaturase/sphingolipid hydroxylase (fatty acid hydroxylase superfamily)
MTTSTSSLGPSLLSPVSDAHAVAITRRSWARSIPALVEVAVLVALPAAGLLCPQGPAAFFLSVAVGFVGIAGPVLLVAWLLTWVGERSGHRLQGPRKSPAKSLAGARDTAVSAYISACLLAWPLARMYAGEPTGLKWSLDAAGGAGVVALETIGALLVLDAWLYWKHRILHTRLLFPFHRAHHGYRDPNGFTSFAVGPVEGLLTFWPVVILAWPRAPHWAPLYFTLVVGFVLLNLYLHCGLSSRILETILGPLLVNTSAYHNRHHANAEVNFAEAFTLWDHLCKTRERDRREPRAASTGAPRAG